MENVIADEASCALGANIPLLDAQTLDGTLTGRQKAQLFVKGKAGYKVFYSFLYGKVGVTEGILIIVHIKVVLSCLIFYQQVNLTHLHLLI